MKGLPVAKRKHVMNNRYMAKHQVSKTMPVVSADYKRSSDHNGPKSTRLLIYNVLNVIV